jgi:hypothetical protein
MGTAQKTADFNPKQARHDYRPTGVAKGAMCLEETKVKQKTGLV